MTRLIARAFMLLARSAGTAQAGTLSDFQLVVGPMGSEMTLSGDQLAAASTTMTENENGTITLTDGEWSEPGVWEFSWDTLQFNPDPFVSFVGGFSNLFAGPMNFTLSTLSPVAPLPNTVIGGSTTVTVADANFDGIGTLTYIAGLPGYSGTIDGANVLDLLFPFSITVPVNGGVASTLASAGLPGPTIPDGPAVATIGITHRFNPTGNDNATFNSTFIVEIPVPEPRAWTLLAGGLAWLAWRRRGAWVAAQR